MKIKWLLLNIKCNQKKARPFVRVAGSRGIEESFRPIISLATTLSGVETIPKVNLGVSIKSSSDVRKGDDIPDDPKRMSRKQYISRSTLSTSLNDASMASLNLGQLPIYFLKELYFSLL